jgi:formyltetrahydrofolate-dependent phosphoribosylglycinamide formyltransferase
VPTFVHRVKDYPDRRAWDLAVRDAVAGYEPDLVVSAGFMKLLGPDFLAAFPGRVVNTHPALLPSFPGMHAVRDALAYGVKVTGCTLFAVTEGVDDGPVIAQTAVPVEDGTTSRPCTSGSRPRSARCSWRRGPDGPQRLDHRRGAKGDGEVEMTANETVSDGRA